MSTNIAQQDSQIKRLPDDLLRQMLMQMTQSGQVGTPAYILAAGEIQTRNNARQKAMAGKGNNTPVIANLLTNGAMPMASQAPMAPEDAGGIADLPAPNMDNINAMAAGGLVAFSNGGTTFRPAQLGVFGSLVGPSANRISRQEIVNQLTAEELRKFNSTGELPNRLKEFVGDRTIAASGAEPRASAGEGLEALGQAQAGAGTAPPPTAAPGAAPPADSAPTVTRVDQPPAAAPITSPAMPAVNFEDAFTKAQGFAKTLIPDQPASTTPEPNAKDLIKERQQLYKDLGIEDPTKMRREQLEKEMKGAKSEREQAGYAWLANFGFTWAATNGPTLQAMAKAGEKTTPGLMSDLKDLNKLDRERQKELAGLAALDAQAQRTTADSVLAEIQRKRERAEDRLDKVEMQRNTIAAALAGNVISAETSLKTTGMTTAASRDAARITANASLARLSEQLAETETKNIIDAAKDMVVRRGDYLTMNEQEQRDALLAAIRTIKQGRRVAGTSVTPSGP